MAVSTSDKFAMIRDINGYNGFGLMFTNFRYSVQLTASTGATLTIPSTYSHYIAIFAIEPGNDLFIANNLTAEVPASGTISATTSEYNPIARQVNAADVLSLISPNTTCYVGITLYAIQ